MSGDGRARRSADSTRTGAARRSTAAVPAAGAANAPHAGLRATQRQAGNRAVAAALRAGTRPGFCLAGAPGHPLPGPIRAELERRFDADLGEVRVHTTPEAATSARGLGARAYTVGRDIVFARGELRPYEAEGLRLLAHEIAHTIQQKRGGAAPALDPAAPHERAAETAADQVARGVGPVAVHGATGVGVARAMDDWLEGTPNISDESVWSYTDLLAEADHIHQWLQNQNTSTPESVRLEEALGMLTTEVARRDRRRGRPAGKPQTRRRRPGRRQAGDDAPAAELASEQAQGLPKPRVLRELRSVEYGDPAEIRQEVDLIVRWLARDDLSEADREVLEAELEGLRPLLTSARMAEAEARRQARLQQALAPRASGGGKSELVDLVRRLDDVRPLSDRPGFSYIMDEGEMLVIPDVEMAAIRAGVAELMDRTMAKVEELKDDAYDKWEYEAQLNREHRFASTVVDIFGGSATSDPWFRLRPHMIQAEKHLTTYRSARQKASFVTMAGALADAAQHAAKAMEISTRWAESKQSTEKKLVTGLTITRDLSAAILTSYFGGAGFVSLVRGGMNVWRAGATVTAIGASANAVLRGGTNLAGQALAPGEIDLGEAWQETMQGAKEGAVNTVSGIATAGTASALGPATTWTGRAVRGGVAGGAGGATGGGLGAALEGGSAEDIVAGTVRGGVQGGIGGTFGGSVSGGPGARAAAARIGVGGGGSAAGGFLGELATGGSIEDARDAAIREGIAGAITASPTQRRPPAGGRDSQRRLAAPPATAPLRTPAAPAERRTPAAGRGRVPATVESRAATPEPTSEPGAVTRPPPAAAEAGVRAPAAAERPRIYVHELGLIDAGPTPPVERGRLPAAVTPEATATPEAGRPAAAEPRPRAGPGGQRPTAAESADSAARDRSAEVAEHFAEAQRIPGAERGESGKRVHDEARSERIRRDQAEPTEGAVRRARTRESHDLGVEGGRAKARQDGVHELDWSWNPKELKGDFGKGPDGIARDRKGTGSYGFVEWKGGESARLEGDQGSAAWAGRKIAQMKVLNDPMADRLLRDARRGNLKTWVYKTTRYDPRTGTFDTQRTHTLHHDADAVLNAYGEELARLGSAVERGRLGDLGEL